MSPVEKHLPFPYSYADWKQRAKQAIDREAFTYVASGAGSEQTMKANEEAFNRWRLLPQVLTDVTHRDMSVSLWGQAMATPFLLAPIGMQGIVHPDGELASARAAKALGVPFIASTVSTFTLEQIASELGASPHWFQLYWSNDMDVTKSLVQRAEAAGYSAIVITVDTALLGWRERDLSTGYSPLKLGMGSANFFHDPVFREKLTKPPEVDRKAALEHLLNIVFHPGLTWDDLASLREITPLPILLKGVLHPDDASLALDCGTDGLIVSNHGGRQLDGAVAALDALQPVCDIVQNRIPVLFDSGVRRGPDVIKAIAMGADAVLLGRPYIYGLAAGGEAGVRHVLQHLISDIDVSLALTGKRTIRELNRSVIVKSNAHDTGPVSQPDVS